MTSNYFKVSELFNLEQTIAKDLFKESENIWDVLPKISEFINLLGRTLPESEYTKYAEDVWVSKSATVASTASISGPTIIDHNAEIRHCAFIRGNAIVGESVIVGNSTELKNVVLFNNVQVPHFNYVGDSILGYKAHMGAGCITSNVKSDKSLVSVVVDNQRIETGLRKFGAILGDRVEVGSNTVLNPGTIVGRDANIYPLSMVRSYVPANSIYKKQGEVIEKYK